MTKTPHRFFRAMVLMSSGVALGCGGLSTDSDRDPNPNPSPSGGGGSGSGSSSGGSAGAFTIPLGGGGSTGSAGGISVAGAAGASVVQPGPFPCPPEQWDCSAVEQSCGYGSSAGYGWDLPEGCACDEGRPLSRAECGTNESFVCRNATTFNDGVALNAVIPYECSCVPTPPDYCQDACLQAFPDLYDASCSGELDTILCGCAVIYLK